MLILILGFLSLGLSKIVLFRFHTILFWFWNQGFTSLIKRSRTYSLCFLEELCASQDCGPLSGSEFLPSLLAVVRIHVLWLSDWGPRFLCSCWPKTALIPWTPSSGPCHMAASSHSLAVYLHKASRKTSMALSLSHFS